MKKPSRQPFFARFLENQQLDDVHGAARRTSKNRDTVYTEKYPSDDDEYVTLKYPSDSDDSDTTL